MNAQPTAPTLPPVPMVRETILKDDGRFLSYYTFPEDASQRPALGEKDAEDTDV